MLTAVVVEDLSPQSKVRGHHRGSGAGQHHGSCAKGGRHALEGHDWLGWGRSLQRKGPQVGLSADLAAWQVDLSPFKALRWQSDRIQKASRAFFTCAAARAVVGPQSTVANDAGAISTVCSESTVD